MPDFEIRILTKSELSGVNATQAALEKQRGRLIALGQDTAKVDAQLSKIGQLLSSQPKSTGFLGAAREQAAGLLAQIPGFEKFSGVVTKLAAGPIGMIALGLGAVAAAFKTAAAAVAEFADKEDAIAELDQVLANTGQLTEATREKFQALAGAWEETIGVADERMVKVLATLSKFGATSANIDQMTEATVNLAGAIGVDVETAAMLFGRAMQGNFQTLARYGFHVDRSATQTEKLNQIMEQAAARGAGVLAAKMGTLHGHFIAFKNSVANVLEGIGNFISRTGILQWAIEKVTVALQFWSTCLPQTAKQLDGIKEKMPGTASAAAGLGEAMGDAADGTGALGDGLGRATDKATQTKTAFDAATESIEGFARAQTETVEAETALKLAEIDLREKQDPTYSKEQAGVDKAKVRLGADRQRLAIQAQAAQGKREAIELSVMEGFSKVEGAKQETAEALAKRNELAQRLGRHPDLLLSGTVGMLGQVNEQIATLGKRKERAAERAEGGRRYMGGTTAQLGSGLDTAGWSPQDEAALQELTTKKAEILEARKASELLSTARGRESSAIASFGGLMDQLSPAWRDIELQQKLLPIQQRTLGVRQRSEVEAPTTTMLAGRAAELNVKALQEVGRDDAKDTGVAIAQAFRQFGLDMTDGLVSAVKAQLPKLKAELQREIDEKLKNVRQ